MAQTVCVWLSPSDRRRLEAIASDRNLPRKHVDRAKIVLASTDGRPVQQVATGCQSADGSALAATFRRSGAGWIAARQDAQSGQAADPGRNSGAWCGADLWRGTAWCLALDRSGHGPGRRHTVVAPSLIPRRPGERVTVPVIEVRLAGAVVRVAGGMDGALLTAVLRAVRAAASRS
jgi:hypothetical protein